MSGPSYHHPKAVSRNITRLGAHPFTTEDGILYAVVEMGDGGSLWLRDKETARELLKAAAGALAILDPPPPAADDKDDEEEAGEDPLTDQTAPYWPAVVVPLNASVQPAFCADCGAPEGLVPLVAEDGVCRCWSAEACDQRQAAAGGYGLTGGTS